MGAIVAGEHKLKTEDKYFDSLADHVQGMISDLNDGIGMGNSHDGSFGDEALANKVNAFEKAWHQTAKPNLIDHLHKLKKHIETTRSEIQALEHKLAQEQKAKHDATPTPLPPRTPVTSGAGPTASSDGTATKVTPVRGNDGATYDTRPPQGGGRY